MSADSQYSFDSLADLCEQINVKIHPSVLHGALTGLLCSGGVVSAPVILSVLAQVMERDESELSVYLEPVQQWCIVIAAQLTDESMSFRPVLEGPEEPLQVRLESLTQWVAVFLSEFAVRHPAELPLPEDSREILEDLAAIANLGVEEDDEADEHDWITVLEHVRLSATSLYLEFHEPEPGEAGAGNTPPVVH